MKQIRFFSARKFLILCLFFASIKLLPFYDEILDTMFHRSQISFTLNEVEFLEDSINFVIPMDYAKAWKMNNLCVWYNFIQGDEISWTDDDPTLCLHSTINYAPLIFEQVYHWQKYMSYAIYIESEDVEAIELFISAVRCHSLGRAYVSVHLVFDGNCIRSPIIRHFKNRDRTIDCTVNTLHLFNKYFQTSYPINSLRNIARTYALTDFFVNSDIENIFSFNASSILKQISSSMNVKQRKATAIVIRRFEVSKCSKIPQNVQQLNTALGHQQAFLFHHDFYSTAHVTPHLSEWLIKSFNSDQTFLQPVAYPSSPWEPLTAVRSSSPQYFEKLVYRYRNQLAYPYELCRAGYDFAVASHVFAVHKGIKQKLSRNEKFFLQSHWDKAVAAWKSFTNYIRKRYPLTKDRCLLK